MIKIENFKVTFSDSQASSISPPEEKKEAKENAQQTLRFHIQVLKPTIYSDDKEEISVSEFAREAGITSQAVRKMIAEGRLQAKRLGNQYAIKREDLYKYFEK